MKHSLAFKIVFVAFLLSFTFHSSQSAAGAFTFDHCVNRLYAFGGLSKDQARSDCLRGLSNDVVECQNKKFLMDFNDPKEALKRCESRLELTKLSDFQLYTGSYESVPTNKSKKTVCSITVNSSDEREAFRKGLNPAEYSWVELLPQNAVGFEDRFIPRDDLWLKKACREKTRCDIVVISGHFASTYLGISGFEVRLEDLTKYSCDENCRELFSSVRQVYLFGCNTLSEKTSDSRSISEYRNILIVDGVSPHLAQRIAARRYTAYGQSLRSEVRHVFPHAEQIFGYAGPGPTGPNIRSTLQTYLKKAYSGENSQTVLNENFRRTLGRTGMLSVSGLPQDPNSCQASPSQLANPGLRSGEGVRSYVLRYARELPVAAFDVVAEASALGLIDSHEATALVSQIKSRFTGVSKNEQRRLLCPQLLTEHPEWVPAELLCKDDPSWLNNGRAL